MRLLSAVVWLAFLSHAAVAQPQFRTGSIEGNVVERDTGAPIAGANIELRRVQTVPFAGTNPPPADSGQLDGGVLDAARKPAAHATVVLVPDGSRQQRLDLYKVTTTNSAGRFRLANVPPGDYTAFAWEDIETGAWLDPQVVRLDEGRGAQVHVGDNASPVTTELTVIPAR
jgi:hypothetical protein